MRKLALATALLALPIAARAQGAPAPQPQSYTLQAATLNHIVAFLRQGGTYAEAGALSDQVVQEVQRQMQPPAPPHVTTPDAGPKPPAKN